MPRFIVIVWRGTKHADASRVDTWIRANIPQNRRPGAEVRRSWCAAFRGTVEPSPPSSEAHVATELVVGRPLLALLAPLGQIRKVSRDIAFAVARQAQREGLAEETTAQALRQRIETTFWHPAYHPVVPA